MGYCSHLWTTSLLQCLETRKKSNYEMKITKLKDTHPLIHSGSDGLIYVPPPRSYKSRGFISRLTVEINGEPAEQPLSLVTRSQQVLPQCTPVLSAGCRCLTHSPRVK